MSAKFKDCQTCYFNNHAPEICEGCIHANEYQPIDSEEIDDEVESLTEFTTQEIL